MANQYLVDSPYSPFTIKNQFKAISNGSVYIGEVDKDPLNPLHQTQVYVVDETGSNVPVSQPIQLNAGGYLVYNGQVSKFITLEPYSMVVLNSVNAEMWRVDDISKVDPDNITASTIPTSDGGSVQDFIDNYDEFTDALLADINDLDSRSTANSSSISELQTKNATQDDRINAIEVGQGAGVIGYATQAGLFANLNFDDGSIGYVTNDTTATKNGTYRKSGASGTGSWVQSSNDLASQAYQQATLNTGVIVNSNQDLLSVGTVVGFISATNGQLQATAGFTASKFIPINNETSFIYNGRLSAATVGLCIYDADKNYLDTLLADGGNYFDTIVTVNNSNARYLRVCSSNTYPATFKAEMQRQNLNWGFLHLPYNLVNYTTMFNNKAIRSTDGVEISSAGNTATDFIPVQAGQRIKFNGRNNSLIGSVVYDKDRQYMKSLVPTSETLEDYWVIPAGASYLRVSNYDGYTLSLLSDVKQPDYATNIVIRFISPTQFFVDSKQSDGTYLNHSFVYSEDIPRAEKGWRSDWIYHNDKFVAQGNFNCVHMTTENNEAKFVGIGHGCETFQWVQFFLDGVEFDPATSTGRLQGDRFSWQFLSDIYIADESAEPPPAELTSPLLPLQLSTVHYMDCSISGGNVIERYNKIVVKRNALSFQHFYSAMQQTQQPLINGVITVNKDEPFRAYFPVSSGVAEPLPPSATPLVDGVIGGGANKIIATGESGGYSYRVETEAWNIKTSERDKHSIQAWVSRETANKFYFSAVVSAFNATSVGLPVDVFYVGDVIESGSKTVIEVTKQ